MTLEDYIFFKRCSSFSYVLQMLQWCVLAGFGMMHFLQKVTEGIATLP